MASSTSSVLILNPYEMFSRLVAGPLYTPAAPQKLQLFQPCHGDGKQNCEELMYGVVNGATSCVCDSRILIHFSGVDYAALAYRGVYYCHKMSEPQSSCQLIYCRGLSCYIS